MKKEFVATSSGDLIKICLESCPKLNYNQLKTALRKKDVKINGIRTSGTIIISSGDKIEIFLPNEKPRLVDYIYQDDLVAVVVKPQGVETTTDDKIFNSERLEELTGNRACHRLDKNTEGLVVLAKNNRAYNEILQAFKNGQVHKKYLCVVTGKPKNQANLSGYLVKDAKNSVVKIFDNKQPNSSVVKTNYKLLEQQGELSLLEVELFTGKTHQIRAHLAHTGIYILGDNKYGDKQMNKKYGIKKQLLCAYNLKFEFEKNSFLSYLNDLDFQISPSFNLSEIANKIEKWSTNIKKTKKWWKISKKLKISVKNKSVRFFSKWKMSL